MNVCSDKQFKAFIGIDAGGTKTHGVLADKNYKILKESYGGSANISSDINTAIESITQVIDSLLNNSNLKIEEVAIGMGVAGYSVLDKRQYLYNALSARYPTKIILQSDCHIACLAAHRDTDGAILICGTGVVGYYISESLGHQIGGWGFPHGDLGGGAWFGLEICRLLCRAIDGVIDYSCVLENLYQDKFNHEYDKYKNWLLCAKARDYGEIAQYALLNHQDDDYVVKLINLGTKELEVIISNMLSTTNNLPLSMYGGMSNIYFDKLKSKFCDLHLGSSTNAALGAVYLSSRV